MAISHGASSRAAEAPRCPIVLRYLVILSIQFLSCTGLMRLLNRAGSVIFISGGYCLKITLKSSTEAHTLTFVRQSTKIPVPKVYCTFEHQNRTYILMERLPGDRLANGWVHRPTASKQRILTQLKGMIAQLRTIERSSGQGVASVTGGPIFDPRLPTTSWWGPFASSKEFHLALRNGIDMHDGMTDDCDFTNDSVSADVLKLQKFQDGETDLVFTHGDLSSLNILCRDDVVTGIIDWETAGWLPGYWEYACAWNANPQNLFWREEVDHFLQASPQVQEMDKIRRRYFGAF